MLNRREFLYLTGVGAAGLLSGQSVGLPPLVRAAGASDYQPDIELALKATVTEQPILPGAPSRVWAFRGDLIKGPAGALQPLADSYLGPIIRVHRGQRIRIHFHNELPQESIIHWHGLHVPADMDGHPRDVIAQGQRYTYEFEVHNRAGTYWYHPHPHGKTGLQVYAGLAGLFIVEDEEEGHLGLPSGALDLPLVLQDRLFNPDNQLVYLTHHMGRMTGFVGDRILINGRLSRTMPIAAQAYRLRILNGSNSRIYRLAWSGGRPLTIIGTDGGLLDKPVRLPDLMLGPAERVDLWADFSALTKGAEATLVSKAIDLTAGGGRMGPRRGMMGGGRVPNGAPLTLVHFRVDRPGKDHHRLPDRLANLPSMASAGATDRHFTLRMQHMQGTINGRVFAMDRVADDETVALGTEEIWEFHNRGGMPSQPHPIHIHGLQFRVLGRLGSPYRGYVDHGWKDTVLLMPGERVRLGMRFADYAGLFLYHCHNLEHEDMGMMRNYYIRSA
jgi:FtsP/CotA-like multicopper oxidase with cupredoxin domain